MNGKNKIIGAIFKVFAIRLKDQGLGNYAEEVLRMMILRALVPSTDQHRCRRPSELNFGTGLFILVDMFYRVVFVFI